MKQVLRRGFSEVVVQDIPAPTLHQGCVLVAPRYSLISSGTETADLHPEGVLREVLEQPSRLRSLGTVAAAYGVIPTVREAIGKFQDLAIIGYSGAGEIIDKDPAISDLAIGDLVAYGGQRSGHGEIVSIPRNLTVGVPTGQSCKEAAFATLGAIAMNGVRAAKIEVGESIAVMGLGLVGQLVLQLGRVAGGRMIGIDLLKNRVGLARKIGFDFGVVAGDGTEYEAINSLTAGAGVDCVIVCAKSQSAVPVEQAVRMLRDRGRLVIVGAVKLDLPRDQMYAKELQVTMARAYGPGSYDPVYELKGVDYPIAYVRWTENRNMEEFLRLIAEKRVSVDALVTHEFALEEAAQAYRQVMTAPNDTLGVLLRYERSIDEVRTSISKERILRLPAVKIKPSARFGVALIGASNIARWAHLPSIRKNPATYLHSVLADRGAAAKGYATRFGATVATTDVEQILKDKAVQLVVVTSRHSEHAAVVTRALLAGKHVFVEKPMAVTIEDCRQILEAEHRSEGVVCVGFNRRYAPVYRTAKQLLSDRVGPVLISFMMNAPWVNSTKWIHAPEEGGGAIVSEAVHFFDLFCWLTDEEPIAVSAGGLRGSIPANIDRNNVSVTLKLSRGSLANLIYTTHGHPRGVQERLEIRTGGRTIIAEDMKRLNVHGKLLKSVNRLIPARGYRELFNDFVQSLLAGSPSPVSAMHGARATVLAIKALQSIETGQTIPVAIDEYT